MEKVVVLFGGPSSEAEVSKKTAASIEKGLKELSIQHTMLEFNEKTWVKDLIAQNPTFVMIAMHGTPGEDGTVQAVLENLGLPFNGCGMKASVLAMDKFVAKKFFKRAGLDVAGEYLIDEDSEIPENLADYGLNLPLVFKPNSGGSSIGVEIVKNESEWAGALARLKQGKKQRKEAILVEEFIAGRELTAGVMDTKPLGVIEILSNDHAFYDYTSKYSLGGSTHVYPAPIATEVYEEVQQLALKAHKSLGCSGISRVDFRYNENENRLVVLEVNTLPGMTATSLVPEMAAYHGFSFSQLLKWIVEDGKNCQTQKSLNAH